MAEEVTANGLSGRALAAWEIVHMTAGAITFGVLTLLYVLEGPPRHGRR